MPVQYTGILEEHRAVRERAGLFDLSHMGELFVEGPEAGAALAHALVTDPPALAVGRAHYSMICAAGRRDPRRPDRLPAGRGAVPRRRQRVATPSSSATCSPSGSEGFRAILDDRSLATALVAVQGPRSVDILGPLTDVDLGALRYYAIAEGTVAGIPALVARTGYTGEDGFEVFVENGRAGRAVGRPARRPAGRPASSRSASAPATRSGSRPACRSTATSSTRPSTRTRPASAGSSSSTKPDDFVGRAALERVAADGPAPPARRPDRARPRDRPPRLPGLRRRAARPASSRAAPRARRSASRSRWPTSPRAMPNPVRCSRSRSATRGSPPRSCRSRSTGGPADRPSRRTGRAGRVRQRGGSAADGPHGSALHQGPRVGPRRRQRARRSGSPSTPPSQLGDIVFVELPEVGRSLTQCATFGVVESVKAVSDLFAPVSGRGRRGQRRPWPAQPELVNSDPYGAGWMLRVTRRRPGRARRAARPGGLRRADRGGLTRRCPTGRTPRPIARGCWRRSGSTRSTSSSPTSPPALRASALDLPEPEPELSLTARLQALAGTQPGRPGPLPRGRRLPPLQPAGRRPDPAPRRVVHGLHARTSPRSARARSRRSTSTSR